MSTPTLERADDTQNIETRHNVDSTTTAANPEAAQTTDTTSRPSICTSCRSYWSRQCDPSTERYCCIVPASVWLKIRLVAVCSILVGLFLLIIFPIPGLLLFQVGVVLLVLGACFVFLDTGRGMIANYWYRSFGPSGDTETARTIEVTGNGRFEEHDNPAFLEGDHPPDYATAIATSPLPSNFTSRRPDITIPIDPVAGSSSDRIGSPDTLPNSVYDPSSPHSIFAFGGPHSVPGRSPPPSYDDVLKENNARSPRDANSPDGSSGPS